MSNIRRRLMMQVRMHSNALPVGFQQVEFIGSNGSEFFTINPFDYNGCVINFKVRYKTLQSDKNSFGEIKNKNRLENGVGWIGESYSANYGKTGLKVGAASIASHGNPNPDTLAHEWIYDQSGVYFDGVKVGENWVYDGIIDDWGVFDNPLSLRFFGTYRQASKDRKSDVEFYYWECKKDGVVKIRLIPCYNKITGVVGMYDVVNKKFYVNEGAGAFVKGPDI